MAPAGEPVGTGLVVSLARPGETLPGCPLLLRNSWVRALSLSETQFQPRAASRYSANEADPLSKPFLEQVDQGARALGFDVDVVMEIRTGDLHPERLSARWQASGSMRSVVQGSLQRKELFDLRDSAVTALPSFLNATGKSRQREAARYIRRKQCRNSTRRGWIHRQDLERRQALGPSSDAAHQV